MEFVEFRDILNKHIKDNVFSNVSHLFVVDVDKDYMWNLYLDSFPPGTNNVFRERREFDCSCCRHYIKSFGNVVAIKDNKMISIWDVMVDDPKYDPVMKALSKYIHSKLVSDVFITKLNSFGTIKNIEQTESGDSIVWNHFYTDLPTKFVLDRSKMEPETRASYRDTKNVLKRSFEEIHEHVIKTVLELIDQKSLYKGVEWEGALRKFLKIRTEYYLIKGSKKRDLYCWDKSTSVGIAIGRIKNHSIGVLLSDISSGMDLDEAVTRYERIVAPTNYKRPKAIFTKKMVTDAQNKIEELGLTSALGRRFAKIDDITINNILFADTNAKNQMSGNVWDELTKESTSNPKKFDRVEEVSIDDFISNILPNISEMEVMVENKHIPNLVSLIAPKEKDSGHLFKWNNNFSWAYNGNITDSMKERVKAAGGRVDGELRFSLQWNDNGDNQDDLDAHCKEPNGNEIWYRDKGRTHSSSGMLDVDIIHPEKKVAVENIIWTDRSRMPEGIYELFVHVYSHRGGRSGFAAEVEFNGQIYSFEYRKPVRGNERIPVAKVNFSKANGFKMINSLDSILSSREEWNLKTNNFYPVSVLMFSPNYWDEQKGIGHKHYLFMIKECVNDTNPNGFFNEFLKEELITHKRVFEALGSKMKVEDSNDQLSGIGFSSTKRNSIVCKVVGSFKRTLKITF